MRFGELCRQLVEHSGDLVVDIFRAVVDMKSKDATVRLLQTLAAKPPRHARYMPIAFVCVCACRAKSDLNRPHKERPHLLLFREFRFAHADHHASDDRFHYTALDSFLLGNPPPSSDSYHVGKDY